MPPQREPPWGKMANEEPNIITVKKMRLKGGQK
jgi:hypothetical protein